MSLRKMVSLERTAPEIDEAAKPMSIGAVSKYPWGLSMRLDQETLDKLDLDIDDVEPGDILHARILLEATSVSKNDTGDGPKCCIEVQVTHMGIENEDTEEAD